jgi:hypothetical protein
VTPDDLDWTEVDASADNAGAAGAEETLESYLESKLVRGAEELGPTVGKDKLLRWLDDHTPPGRRGSKTQRIAALHRAVRREPDLDRIVEVDIGKQVGGKDVYRYEFAAAEEAAP